MIHDPLDDDSLYWLSKEEFRAAARGVKPDITDEEFNALWEDFWDRKEEYLRRRALH